MPQQKKANNELQKVNTLVENQSNVICIRKGELTTMGKLSDLTNKYNELVEIANSLGGEYQTSKLLKCKITEAEAKITDLETFIKNNQPKDKQTKKEEQQTMAKKDKADKKKAAAEKKAAIVITFGQWIILQLFKKDEMKYEKLNEAYVKATGKEKGLGLILSQMEKKGFVAQSVEGETKLVEITKVGKEAKAADKPEETAAKKETAPPFVVPHSQEEIDGAKKEKKKAKMIKANEKALAEYQEKYKGLPPARQTNNYDGKITIGQYQEELPKRASMREKSKAACKDLFFEKVTVNILLKKSEYVALAMEHGITKTTAIAIWKECTEGNDKINQERLAIANSRATSTILPELELKEKKNKKKGKKDKSGKKDKKDKKSETQIEEVETKKDKSGKKDKKGKKGKKNK